MGLLQVLFSLTRGIRRRGIPCPLTFSRLLWKRRTLIVEESTGEIIHMRTGVNFEVSQMIFADDLQVFSNGNEESLEGIRRVFYISRGCLGWRSLKIREEFPRIEFVLKGFRQLQILGMDEGCLPIDVPRSAFVLRPGQ